MSNSNTTRPSADYIRGLLHGFQAAEDEQIGASAADEQPCLQGTQQQQQPQHSLAGSQPQPAAPARQQPLAGSRPDLAGDRTLAGQRDLAHDRAFQGEDGE